MKADAKLSAFLFYDTLDVLDIIKPVVMPCFHSIYELSMEHDMPRFFRLMKDAHYSAVFVFACGSPTTALNFIRAVENQDEESPSLWKKYPSEAVLICDKHKRASAFTMCRNNLFYSYETMRPIYDLGKVQLMLNRVSQHAMTRADLYYAELESRTMTNEIAKSNEELNRLLESTITHRNESALLLQSILDREPNTETLGDQYWENLFSEVIDGLTEKDKSNLNTLLSPNNNKAQLSQLMAFQQKMFASFESSIERAKPKLHVDKMNLPVVIVADDQPVMQRIIRSILEPRGYQVELANHGVEVLLKSQSTEPDLILLDIDMPVMNGFETLTLLKSTPALATIPVIMLTSFSDKEVFSKSIKSGAVDYIVKPTNAEILIRKITPYIVAAE
ncbi:response regulator [Vibrio tritonius]|uniref:Response regulator n=1 Tax=Vibrio tritonius TaxID=1435069 RepID=A0ABS7YSH9_9VIBR|nr:response regulator [Vibrio tritonius]MCA2017389.1 response regulator [Vibrio tritonius]